MSSVADKKFEKPVDLHLHCALFLFDVSSTCVYDLGACGCMGEGLGWVLPGWNGGISLKFPKGLWQWDRGSLNYSSVCRTYRHHLDPNRSPSSTDLLPLLAFSRLT